eukprot:7387275-Prymnesium_polylepis.2
MNDPNTGRGRAAEGWTPARSSAARSSTSASYRGSAPRERESSSTKAASASGSARIERSTSRQMTLPLPSQIALSGACGGTEARDGERGYGRRAGGGAAPGGTGVPSAPPPRNRCRQSTPSPRKPRPARACTPSTWPRPCRHAAAQPRAALRRLQRPRPRRRRSRGDPTWRSLPLTRAPGRRAPRA